MLVNSIVGFTLFSTYTLTESALKYVPEDNLPRYYIPGIAGATAGAAQAIISHPLDNVRAVLASRASSANRTSTHAPWKGWRHIAFRAIFPDWLTATTSARKQPIRFVVNWMRSTSSLFTLTLLRDSIGFAIFFSIFELSRDLAKRAGKAVDRWQAEFGKTSKDAIGYDVFELLENDMLPRGWSGRFVQAFCIVTFGVCAGVGYGIFGRPFDKARTVVWDGLQEWSTQRKAEEAARAKAQAAKQPKVEPERGSTAIAAVPSRSSKAAAHAVPSIILHRKRHNRLAVHETRLPLHPPRLAEPSKHPLKPRTEGSPPTSAAVPSALSLLRKGVHDEGIPAMLGFSKSTASLISSFAPTTSVFSRRQLAKSSLSQGSSSLRGRGTSKTLTQSIQTLSEHPALGGASVFDNLPDPEDKSMLKTQHRKARWYHRTSRRTSGLFAGAPRMMRRIRAGFTVTNVFRVIPPYCFGFLAYSFFANDFDK